MIQEKHELNDLLSAIIPIGVYKGCLVTKVIGGYKIFDKTVTHPYEVDQIIKDAEDSLKNSLK
jgi:hypothetical protein